VHAPYFNPETECFIVLHLNTRRRLRGHHLASIGTLDTILVHPREVFRAALIAAAAAVVLMHNLCNATHKLCYVNRRHMCRRKEPYGSN
jgi:DNA repair protein RadC